MGKSKTEERLGMTFVSNEGCKFFVKEYVNACDVIVKFCDEHGAEAHTKWQHCKNGNVKNPYFKSVYGVACLGEGDFKTTVNGKLTREYSLWKHMLERCYSGEEQYKTYANVTVCDRWLCFANFLEDLPLIENYDLWRDNPNQHIALDKDLKQVGVENKVYSLDTVKFVTSSENSQEVHERTNSRKVICLETKQIFGCVKDAEKWCGKTGISKCCKGRCKTTGGYHWMYLDDYKRQLRKQSDINNSRLAA